MDLVFPHCDRMADLLKALRSGGFAFMLALGGGLPGAAWAQEPAKDQALAECMQGKPPELAGAWQAICAGEKRNQVLDHMRAGLAALALGHDDLAEHSFDTALLGIEQVYAETESAEKARSVWHAEAVKDFKGEPYERVMAYYYRGLLYLRRGDWENAQASFKAGILQDTFAELERFRADVASLVWLEGWANRCRGNAATAEGLFAEAGALRGELKPPASDATLLIVAETGQGPSKRAGGANGEKLVVQEGLSTNFGLVASVGGKTVAMAEAEDLFFQASTRGGRAADGILAEKASTKQTTKGVAKAAMTAGSLAALNGQSGGGGNQALIGLGLMLAGAIAEAAANSMETAADTRTWDTLPHSIHLAAASLPAGAAATVAMDLRDPAGRSLLKDASVIRRADARPCSIAWIGAGSIAASQAVAMAPGHGGSGVEVTGNCMAASGKLTFADPVSCERFGGKSISAGSTAPAPAPPAQPAAGGGGCLTSTGAATFADPDTCARIGGRFVR